MRSIRVASRYPDGRRDSNAAFWSRRCFILAEFVMTCDSSGGSNGAGSGGARKPVAPTIGVGTASVHAYAAPLSVCNCLFGSPSDHILAE